MPSLPQVRPEPRAVLAWPWRVLVLLILAGPPCILAVVAALAYTGRPELKVWLDWMQLFVLMDIIGVLGQMSLPLGDMTSSYTLWKESKPWKVDLVVIAGVQATLWLFAALLCFGPTQGYGVSTVVLPTLRAYFPALATQLETSRYLDRRALISTATGFWICVTPLALVAAAVRGMWAHYRSVQGRGAGVAAGQEGEAMAWPAVEKHTLLQEDEKLVAKEDEAA